jgi:hypothetical protein
MTRSEWVKLSVCYATERFDWHAALSTNGKYCYVVDNGEDIIWDVYAGKMMWTTWDMPTVYQSDPIEDVVSDDFVIQVINGPAAGIYRPAFGLYDGDGIIRCGSYSLEGIGVANLSSGSREHLSYDDWSGDWQYFSFSENCEVIAILTPYVLTFYGHP